MDERAKFRTPGQDRVRDGRHMMRQDDADRSFIVLRVVVLPNDEQHLRNHPLAACPACGDERGIPADTNDRVAISITWHELRVLVMWAEFWATSSDDDAHRSMRKVVYGISDALQLQHLDKPALTFAGEIADLKEEFGEKNVQVIRAPRPDRDPR